MRVAINQPYWCPYKGWYRLLSETDIFISLDCVQFPRRGWVHRNNLKDRNGTPQWFTLPLRHAPQETLMRDMQFVYDADEILRAQARRFPALDRLPKILEEAIFEDIHRDLCPYNERLLLLLSQMMGLRIGSFTQSSLLKIDPELHGQDRIIAICKFFGAKRYLNSPGGRGLYDEQKFAHHGIRLEFLEPWTGDQASVLETIAQRGASLEEPEKSEHGIEPLAREA